MHFDKFSFGSLHIDGSTYEHDLVIDRGAIRKRFKHRQVVPVAAPDGSLLPLANERSPSHVYKSR
jgi:hypothetical protein